jgi:hypothetical protein
LNGVLGSGRTENGETGEEQSQEHAHYLFAIKRPVHKEFVLAGQTVNSAYYCDVLQRLNENVRRRLPELQRQENWLLHHDNAPSHISFFATELFTKNKMAFVSHHPIFFLFR